MRIPFLLLFSLILSSKLVSQELIKKEFFEDSSTKTHCDWNGSTKLTTRGEASYFSLNVDGQNNKDAAWYYPDPKSMAAGIKGHVAFWKGVKVEK